LSEFTCLQGEPALSDFRKRKLARRIAEISGNAGALEANFVYLIESGVSLESGEIARLQDLLHGELTRGLDDTGLLLVVPRLGTQSPWSSKATDIARAMVARYGMDEDLGHVSYDTDRPGFLGTGDQASWLNRRYSEATAERMDLKVRDIVDGVFKRTLTLLETNLDLLEQSAQDLLQRETLDEPDLVAIGSKVKRTEAVAA